jgi:hypothetical protein
MFAGLSFSKILGTALTGGLESRRLNLLSLPVYVLFVRLVCTGR